ncbi:MAG: hypothetical protein D6741_14780 [Planctomycetota bacterium]|nr:MAG: hypothetical protein D6741_14780 [Planctomycetota bacterium]
MNHLTLSRKLGNVLLAGWFLYLSVGAVGLHHHAGPTEEEGASCLHGCTVETRVLSAGDSKGCPQWAAQSRAADHDDAYCPVCRYQRTPSAAPEVFETADQIAGPGRSFIFFQTVPRSGVLFARRIRAPPQAA